MLKNLSKQTKIFTFVSRKTTDNYLNMNSYRIRLCWNSYYLLQVYRNQQIILYVK